MSARNTHETQHDVNEMQNRRDGGRVGAADLSASDAAAFLREYGRVRVSVDGRARRRRRVRRAFAALARKALAAARSARAFAARRDPL